MSFGYSFSTVLPINFLVYTVIPLPDDLLVSGTDYGADLLAILLDFFVVLFLIILSLLFLRNYISSADVLEKFFVASNLYLLLWEFFFVLFFWSFFDLFFLFDDDAPTLLFNLLVFDDATRRIFIVFLLLPIFIDIFVIFFYQYALKFAVFGKLVALELPIILTSIYFFSIFLLRSFDLFLVYLLLESISFLLVIVLVLSGSADSTEAAIKYFSINAVSGGFYLFGSVWFYGLVGNTDFFTLLNYFYGDDFILSIDLSTLTLPFLLILVSFSFKLSVFPGHAWAPDVYAGSSYALIYLISVFFKLVFIFIFIEILHLSFYFIYFWRIFLVFSSFGSAFVSFLGAFRQNNLKRWLAYSTINQLGFILLALVSYDSFFGFRAIFFYILSYLASVTILFSIVSYAFNINSGELTTVSDLVSFCRVRSVEALYITFVLFSLAGLPPFIGFFSKYFILLALFDSGLSFILFVFFLLNAFSAYYYIRLIQVIWADSNLFLFSPNMQFVCLDFLFSIVPGQQSKLKVVLFLLLPLFLNDLLELSTLLSSGDYSWV